jgi:hypothetical protein
MGRNVRSWVAGVGLAVAGALALTGCGDDKKNNGPPASQEYGIGGTVGGLQGTGLVLHSSLGDDLSISADGPFTFPTKGANGTAYQVTIAQLPSSPTQTCTVADGEGEIAGADVVVTVTCSTTAYHIGGTVTGLEGAGLVLHNNLGDDLPITGNDPFTFPTLAATGTQYSITVTDPVSPSQACTVDHPTGTVGGADVVLNVSCSTNSFTVGVTVGGLTPADGLVLQNNGGDDLTVDADGPFNFTTKVTSGAKYEVTIKTQPLPSTCRIESGSGTVGNADVSVPVSCSATVVQRWAAPATWGAAWKDDGHMVQHAYFQSTTGSDTVVVEEKGVTWAVESGPLTAPKKLEAFPAGPRYGAGPFSGATRLQASAGDANLTGDMLVCAIVKPDYDPVTGGNEKAIVADGVVGAAGGGWALVQTGSDFGFAYRATTTSGLATTPTRFADQGDPSTGPLNPSYLVLCGGRDGNTIRVAGNGYVCVNEQPGEEVTCSYGTATVAGTLDAGSHPLTIGGYDTGSANHAFGGRVYETAVWSEAATPENIKAKLAEAQGLWLNESERVALSYTRNREGPFIGIDSKYHTTWRHGPRFDPEKGLLFGLQAWNRVARCTDGFSFFDCGTDLTQIFARGEALDLWTKVGAGVQVQANQAEPPGDSEKDSAEHVTLPNGTSITTPLAAFDAAGVVHGQIWLRVASDASGTLRVRTSNPASSTTSQHDINLGDRGLLPAGTWTRVWLSGLTTNGAEGNLILEAPSGNIAFDAWGVDLTQIAHGGDLGSFDPGPAMYDWNGAILDARFPIDVLQLPTVPASTDADGFCLVVEAQPPAGLAWDAPFVSDRALLTWLDAAGNAVNLFIAGAGGGHAQQLCANVPNAQVNCATLPSSFTPGSKHTLALCAEEASDHVTSTITLYADGNVIGTPDPGEPPPVDLATGHVIVGNNDFVTDSPNPHGPGGNSLATWQGYISKVVVCQAGDLAACQ